MLFSPPILGLSLTSFCFWCPTSDPLANAVKSLQNILRTWPCLPHFTATSITCRGYCNDSPTGFVGSATACLLQCLCNSIARLILSKDKLDPRFSFTQYPPVSPPLGVNTDVFTVIHGLTSMTCPQFYESIHFPSCALSPSHMTLLVVLQTHQTQSHLDGFALALSTSGNVFLPDIFRTCSHSLLIWAQKWHNQGNLPWAPYLK